MKFIILFLSFLSIQAGAQTILNCQSGDQACSVRRNVVVKTTDLIEMTSNTQKWGVLNTCLELGKFHFQIATGQNSWGYSGDKAYSIRRYQVEPVLQSIQQLCDMVSTGLDSAKVADLTTKLNSLSSALRAPADF